MSPGPSDRVDSRESTASAAPGPLVTSALIALLCLIWGSTWLVIREGLRDLPPFTGAGARFVVAGLAMTLMAPRLARAEGGAAPSLVLSLAMGLLNFGLSYGIVYWTETILPSGLVSVLWAVFPMMTAVAGHLYLPGEALRPRQWLGFLVGFAGVALLFATDLAQVGPEALLAGAILLVSPAVSTVGTTLVKARGRHVSSALLNRNGMWIGATVLLAVAFAVESPTEVRWTRAAVASVLYLSLAGTVVTFGLYFWLMRFTSASKLSLIAYATPVIALTLGTLVGDEPFGRNTLGGTVLVLTGVALVLMTRGRGARVPPAGDDGRRARELGSEPGRNPQVAQR